MSTDGRDFIMLLNGSDQIKQPHMLLRDYRKFPEDAPGYVRFGVEAYGEMGYFTRLEFGKQFGLTSSEIESIAPKLVGLMKSYSVIPEDEADEEDLEIVLDNIDIYRCYIEKDGGFHEVGCAEKQYFQKEAKKWLDKLNAIIETDTTDYDFDRNVILFDGYDVKIVDMDKSPYLR